MTAEQEAALRVAKELTKGAVKHLEVVFGVEDAAEICMPLMKAVDVMTYYGLGMSVPEEVDWDEVVDAIVEGMESEHDEIARLRAQIQSNGEFMRAQDETIAALRKAAADKDQELSEARKCAERRKVSANHWANEASRYRWELEQADADQRGGVR